MRILVFMHTSSYCFLYASSRKQRHDANTALCYYLKSLQKVADSLAAIHVWTTRLQILSQFNTKSDDTYSHFYSHLLHLSGQLDQKTVSLQTKVQEILIQLPGMNFNGFSDTRDDGELADLFREVVKDYNDSVRTLDEMRSLMATLADKVHGYPEIDLQLPEVFEKLKKSFDSFDAEELEHFFTHPDFTRVDIAATEDSSESEDSLPGPLDSKILDTPSIQYPTKSVKSDPIDKINQENNDLFKNSHPDSLQTPTPWSESVSTVPCNEAGMHENSEKSACPTCGYSIPASVYVGEPIMPCMVKFMGEKFAVEVAEKNNDIASTSVPSSPTPSSKHNSQSVSPPEEWTKTSSDDSSTVVKKEYVHPCQIQVVTSKKLATPSPASSTILDTAISKVSKLTSLLGKKVKAKVKELKPKVKDWFKRKGQQFLQSDGLLIQVDELQYKTPDNKEQRPKETGSATSHSTNEIIPKQPPPEAPQQLEIDGSQQYDNDRSSEDCLVHSADGCRELSHQHYETGRKVSMGRAPMYSLTSVHDAVCSSVDKEKNPLLTRTTSISSPPDARCEEDNLEPSVNEITSDQVCISMSCVTTETETITESCEDKQHLDPESASSENCRQTETSPALSCENYTEHEPTTSKAHINPKPITYSQEVDDPETITFFAEYVEPKPVAFSEVCIQHEPVTDPTEEKVSCQPPIALLKVNCLATSEETWHTGLMPYCQPGSVSPESEHKKISRAKRISQVEKNSSSLLLADKNTLDCFTPLQPSRVDNGVCRAVACAINQTSGVAVLKVFSSGDLLLIVNLLSTRTLQFACESGPDSSQSQSLKTVHKNHLTSSFNASQCPFEVLTDNTLRKLSSALSRYSCRSPKYACSLVSYHEPLWRHTASFPQQLLALIDYIFKNGLLQIMQWNLVNKLWLLKAVFLAYKVWQAIASTYHRWSAISYQCFSPSEQASGVNRPQLGVKSIPKPLSLVCAKTGSFSNLSDSSLSILRLFREDRLAITYYHRLHKLQKHNLKLAIVDKVHTETAVCKELDNLKSKNYHLSPLLAIHSNSSSYKCECNEKQAIASSRYSSKCLAFCSTQVVSKPINFTLIDIVSLCVSRSEAPGTDNLFDGIILLLVIKLSDIGHPSRTPAAPHQLNHTFYNAALEEIAEYLIVGLSTCKHSELLWKYVRSSILPQLCTNVALSKLTSTFQLQKCIQLGGGQTNKAVLSRANSELTTPNSVHAVKPRSVCLSTCKHSELLWKYVRSSILPQLCTNVALSKLTSTFQLLKCIQLGGGRTNKAILHRTTSEIATPNSVHAVKSRSATRSPKGRNLSSGDHGHLSTTIKNLKASRSEHAIEVSLLQINLADKGGGPFSQVLSHGIEHNTFEVLFWSISLKLHVISSDTKSEMIPKCRNSYYIAYATFQKEKYDGHYVQLVFTCKMICLCNKEPWSVTFEEVAEHLFAGLPTHIHSGRLGKYINFSLPQLTFSELTNMFHVQLLKCIQLGGGQTKKATLYRANSELATTCTDSVHVVKSSTASNPKSWILSSGDHGLLITNIDNLRVSHSEHAIEVSLLQINVVDKGGGPFTQKLLHGIQRKCLELLFQRISLHLHVHIISSETKSVMTQEECLALSHCQTLTLTLTLWLSFPVSLMKLDGADTQLQTADQFPVPSVTPSLFICAAEAINEPSRFSSNSVLWFGYIKSIYRAVENLAKTCIQLWVLISTHRACVNDEALVCNSNVILQHLYGVMKIFDQYLQLVTVYTKQCLPCQYKEVLLVENDKLCKYQPTSQSLWIKLTETLHTPLHSVPSTFLYCLFKEYGYATILSSEPELISKDFSQKLLHLSKGRGENMLYLAGPHYVQSMLSVKNPKDQTLSTQTLLRVQVDCPPPLPRKKQVISDLPPLFRKKRAIFDPPLLLISNQPPSPEDQATTTVKCIQDAGIIETDVEPFRDKHFSESISNNSPPAIITGVLTCGNSLARALKSEGSEKRAICSGGYSSKTHSCSEAKSNVILQHLYKVNRIFYGYLQLMMAYADQSLSCQCEEAVLEIHKLDVYQQTSQSVWIKVTENSCTFRRHLSSLTFQTLDSCLIEVSVYAIKISLDSELISEDIRWKLLHVSKGRGENMLYLAGSHNIQFLLSVKSPKHKNLDAQSSWSLLDVQVGRPPPYLEENKPIWDPGENLAILNPPPLQILNQSLPSEDQATTTVWCNLEQNIIIIETEPISNFSKSNSNNPSSAIVSALLMYGNSQTRADKSKGSEKKASGSRECSSETHSSSASNSQDVGGGCGSSGGGGSGDGGDDEDHRRKPSSAPRDHVSFSSESDDDSNNSTQESQTSDSSQEEVESVSSEASCHDDDQQLVVPPVVQAESIGSSNRTHKFECKADIEDFGQSLSSDLFSAEKLHLSEQETEEGNSEHSELVTLSSKQRTLVPPNLPQSSNHSNEIVGPPSYAQPIANQPPFVQQTNHNNIKSCLQKTTKCFIAPMGETHEEFLVEEASEEVDEDQVSVEDNEPSTSEGGDTLSTTQSEDDEPPTSEGVNTLSTTQSEDDEPPTSEGVNTLSTTQSEEDSVITNSTSYEPDSDHSEDEHHHFVVFRGGDLGKSGSQTAPKPASNGALGGTHMKTPVYSEPKPRQHTQSHTNSTSGYASGSTGQQGGGDGSVTTLPQTGTKLPTGASVSQSSISSTTTTQVTASNTTSAILQDGALVIPEVFIFDTSQTKPQVNDHTITSDFASVFEGASPENESTSEVREDEIQLGPQLNSCDNLSTDSEYEGESISILSLHGNYISDYENPSGTTPKCMESLQPPLLFMINYPAGEETQGELVSLPEGHPRQETIPSEINCDIQDLIPDQSTQCKQDLDSAIVGRTLLPKLFLYPYGDDSPAPMAVPPATVQAHTKLKVFDTGGEPDSYRHQERWAVPKQCLLDIFSLTVTYLPDSAGTTLKDQSE